MTPYTPVIAELGTIFLAAGVAYAGYKIYGREKIVFFLVGSILWTSIIENLGVLEGSYTYYTYAGLFGNGIPDTFCGSGWCRSGSSWAGLS